MFLLLFLSLILSLDNPSFETIFLDSYLGFFFFFAPILDLVGILLSTFHSVILSVLPFRYSIIYSKKLPFIWANFNPTQDGREGEKEGAKRPPYQFSPVTFTIVGISPQNVLNFSFNPFATLV